MVVLPAHRRDQLRSATHVARIRGVMFHVLVVCVERPLTLSDEAAETRGEHAASAAENSAAIHHPRLRAANAANVVQRLPQSRFGLVRFWLTHLGVCEAGPARRKLRMHNLANTIHVASCKTLCVVQLEMLVETPPGFYCQILMAQSEHDMSLSTQITCSASLTATDPIFSDGTHHVSSYRDKSHVNDVDVVVVVVVVVLVVVVVDVAGGGLEHPCKEIARNTSTETAI
eukprot:CAMPEP_0194493576 /NCGR_PEP_ID=MMETSP0253-20130528/11744_1 /TAXON_ID=2966 /ORGANISM="Noctiluca scintillans" /LENGTH=228 /DNA_ID=CAMNT_0039334579 /DNA_START=475 /DNA_END=1159 /DNA_ORIENTATION=-